MTINEISSAAKNNQPIPLDSTIAEMGLYCKLSRIYRGYDSKEITAANAKKLKAKAVEEYEHDRAKDAEIKDLTARIEQHLVIFAEDERRRKQTEIAKTEAIKCGCEHCKKLVAAIDGLAI